MSSGKKQRYYPVGNFAPDFDEPEPRRGTNFNLSLPQGGGGGSDGRLIPGVLSYSGPLPAQADVRASIIAAYNSASATPAIGDIIYMTEYHYEVVPRRNILGSIVSQSDIFRVGFEVGGTEYMAFQRGPVRFL